MQFDDAYLKSNKQTQQIWNIHLNLLTACIDQSSSLEVQKGKGLTITTN